MSRSMRPLLLLVLPLVAACDTPTKVFNREKVAVNVMLQALATVETVRLPPTNGNDLRSPGIALRFPPVGDANAIAIPQSALSNPGGGGRFEHFYDPVRKVARWLAGSEFLPDKASEVKAATSAVKGLEFVLLITVEEWIDPAPSGDRFTAGRAVVRGDLIRIADKEHYGAVRVDVANSPTALTIVRNDGSGNVPDSLQYDLEQQVFGYFRTKLSMKLPGTKF